MIWFLVSFLIYSLHGDIKKRSFHKFWFLWLYFSIDLISCLFSVLLAWWNKFSLFFSIYFLVLIFCVFFNVLLTWWYQRKKLPQISFDLISHLISSVFLYTPCEMTLKASISTNFFGFNFSFDKIFCVFFYILLGWWHPNRGFQIFPSI